MLPALERHEKRTRPKSPSVRRDSGCHPITGSTNQGTSGRKRYLGKRKRTAIGRNWCHHSGLALLCESLSRFVPVVERHPHPVGLLVRLVSLSGQKHYVAGPRGAKSPHDRTAAV